MAVEEDYTVQKTNFSKRRQSSKTVRVGKPIYIWRWLIHDTPFMGKTLVKTTATELNLEKYIVNMSKKEKKENQLNEWKEKALYEQFVR